MNSDYQTDVTREVDCAVNYSNTVSLIGHFYMVTRRLFVKFIKLKALLSFIPNILNYDFLDRHLRDLIGSRHVVNGPEKSVTDCYA